MNKYCNINGIKNKQYHSLQPKNVFNFFFMSKGIYVPKFPQNVNREQLSAIIPPAARFRCQFTGPWLPLIIMLHIISWQVSAPCKQYHPQQTWFPT
jgi:hypothetical protein